VDGEFFVDQSCIDCETCRQLAPASFARSPAHGQSFVFRQPTGEAEHTLALAALVACPTSSIGTVHKLDVTPGVRAFPQPIADGVYYCGFAAEASFGASSYLIRRPGGNVLVDSPRAARPLMRRLEELGGVLTMFLTHRDDVADHAEFHKRFGCARMLHEDDVSAATRGLERTPGGSEPIALADDLLVIPVPGHTRGSCALLYRERFLFSGDHLWGDEDDGHLAASRSVCWYSWREQVRSVEKLLAHRFEWVLPGHGRPFKAASPAAMRVELSRLLDRMRARSS